jgi:hypothetical protein
MTAYHLKSWSKMCGSVEIDRIYVNADDRSSLGFIERRTATEVRGTDSYYDRHRVAKGDTEAVVSDKITTTVPAEALEKIIAAAIATDSRYGFLATTDDMGRFLALKEFTRGIDWIGSRSKSLKRLAASFTVEI